MPIEVESPEELGYGTIANNLAESSFADQRLADLGVDADVGDLLLQYGDHRGLPELRELIAGTELDPADLLVTAGAAAALFIVATSLLQPGDHALIVRPNYATNVETPRAIGADAEFLDLRFEDGWRLDVDRVAAALRDDTQLVSVCVPHNPTGRTMDLGDLVALVERHPTARLLVDETYRELAYDAPAPQAATRSERVIAVASLSKAYGLPGLRIGWIACRDRALSERFLAAREQILIAGSLLDETMAARVLARREAVLPGILDARPPPPGDRRGLVRRPGALRVASARGRRGLLPAAAPGARRRPRRLLRRAAAPPRHLRRPRPLVRAGPPLLPARLRLARRRPAAARARRPGRRRPRGRAGRLEQLVQLGHDGVRAGAAQLLGRGEPARDRDHEVGAGAAAGRHALGGGGDGDDPLRRAGRAPRSPRRASPRSARSARRARRARSAASPRTPPSTSAIRLPSSRRWSIHCTLPLSARMSP